MVINTDEDQIVCTHNYPLFVCDEFSFVPTDQLLCVGPISSLANGRDIVPSRSIHHVFQCRMSAGGRL